ncbi:MAG TPA: DUF721 domain-containing protein [Alphaproteobacteria bacterium]
MPESSDKSRNTRRGLATLGQSVGRVTTPAMRRRGFAEAAIVTDWETIVGRPLADHTRPDRVTFPRGGRRDGTLHLLVTSAFAPEVQHLAPEIIERINGHFGYGAIARLELHHAPIVAPDRRAAAARETEAPDPDPALAAAIAAVGEERLGAALGRLARARAGAAARPPRTRGRRR